MLLGRERGAYAVPGLLRVLKIVPLITCSNTTVGEGVNSFTFWRGCHDPPAGTEGGECDRGLPPCPVPRRVVPLSPATRANAHIKAAVTPAPAPAPRHDAPSNLS